MTDYLELISEEADVLLKEHSRLERMRLSAHNGQTIENEEAERWDISAATQESELPLITHLNRAEDEHRQAERLRNVSRTEGGHSFFVPRKGAAGEVYLSPEGRPATVRYFGERELHQDGEQLIREMDRTFRRDSRRYDGGFYLY